MNRSVVRDVDSVKRAWAPGMILIGIGSNLPAPGYATPQATAIAGLAVLPTVGARVVATSPWYLSEPVPPSDQPWFVNAVASLASELSPEELLARLLALETRFGRTRSGANAARTLDLDLLDYGGMLRDTPMLTLPHPRLHERRFVLEPVCDIAAQWRHPRLGLTASELLATLPPGQELRRINA
jgi:2-amino-4-hydroxy-6-hydroxymethyldihydropteridine diphosphokinase